MIEPIMYVAIGFLVACTLIICFIPFVHRRAVRLTTRRLEAATPMSMAEIHADKDQLRAEFAMSTRRLEMSVEQMKSKTTSQLAEIGKKSESIGRLKLELGEKTEALFALEAREKQLTEDLAETQRQRDENATARDEAERLLAETRAELATTTAAMNASALTVDGLRVELVTVRAQTEVLKGQVETYDREIRELNERLQHQITDANSTRNQLSDESSKSETLSNRIVDLERQLIAQTTEAEVRGRRVEELLARVDEQGRFLAEREHASDMLRTESSNTQKVVSDLRAELAETENRRRSGIESLQNERQVLENQLQQSHAEKARLQEEITAIKREVETAWANERMENAVLRERINDVAAEVARLTSVLEGPGSQIDTILAGDAARAPTVPLAPAAANPVDRALGAVAAINESSKGSLADRIRALQSRSPRVPEPSRA